MGKVNIKLGQKVRDKVTGFEGVAISRVEYLNGCIQFCVKPRVDKDGKDQDGQYVDEAQLEVVKEPKAAVKKSDTGGPSANAPRPYYTPDRSC